MEPYAIIGGNPAKMIRKRFDETGIAMLRELKWWNWTEDQLHTAMPLLTSGNIQALHDHWRKTIKAKN